MSWRVPLTDRRFDREEEVAVIGMMRSRGSSMGSVSERFEHEFATFAGTEHALAVSNGTAALHLACLALGLGPGDEVILPSLTFVATAHAVRYSGATPVFADIQSLDCLNLSPGAIEASLTERTRAILVAHYAGFACDMPAILEIAQRHNLAVIEDAAHAVGSELQGRMLGTWGDIGCYSFFSNEDLTGGEGGMVVTDHDALAEKLCLLRSHGMTASSWDRYDGHASSYDVVNLGFNYQIDELRSALGRVQLETLVVNNERRRVLTNLYKSLIAELVPVLHVPFQTPQGCPCYQLMPVLLPAEVDRPEFISGMKLRGIQTGIHYPPVHQFKLYRQDVPEHQTCLSFTEEAAAREVTLPLYPAMQEEQVEWVTRAARDVLRELQ